MTSGIPGLHSGFTLSLQFPDSSVFIGPPVVIPDRIGGKSPCWPFVAANLLVPDSGVCVDYYIINIGINKYHIRLSVIGIEEAHCIQQKGCE